MADFEEQYLKLVFNQEEVFATSPDPTHYVLESSGKMFLTDLTQKESIEIGEFKTVIVDVDSAMDDNYSLIEIFDIRQSLYDYTNLYNMKSWEFKKSVLDVLDDEPFDFNLLIIDRLTIYPKFRGKNLGLVTLRTLIRRLSHGVGLIVLKPFPLQFESTYKDGKNSDHYKELGFDLFSDTEEKAEMKLVNYYEKMGFRKVRRLDYMVRSPDIVLPDIEEFRSGLS
jgi:GNAT superfamily N-acetyltransferase